MTRVSDAERIAEFTVSAISERRFELAGALARLMLQAYRIERDSAVAPAVPVVFPVCTECGTGQCRGHVDADLLPPCGVAGHPTGPHHCRTDGVPVVIPGADYRGADEAPTAVTPSARCTFPISPGTECHRVLYWRVAADLQPGEPRSTSGFWEHLDGSSDHAPTPDRFL